MRHSVYTGRFHHAPVVIFIQSAAFVASHTSWYNSDSVFSPFLDDRFRQSPFTARSKSSSPAEAGSSSRVAKQGKTSSSAPTKTFTRSILHGSTRLSHKRTSAEAPCAPTQLWDRWTGLLALPASLYWPLWQRVISLRLPGPIPYTS